MSIKNNFFYSLVLTASNYIFPLLVYPYISRVLGVDGIGICNFADSIINYFALFSTIGISIIGIREIASAKKDHESLNMVFTSLIVHTIIPTLIACIVFLLALFSISELSDYKEILFIGIGKILGIAFMLDWFYKGMEEFKYIKTDSREVVRGDVFVAIHGYNVDHSQYIDDAINNGASMIITDKKINTNIPCLKVDKLDNTLIELCKNIYGYNNDLNLIGITGTDGKTTSATILKNLFS